MQGSMWFVPVIEERDHRAGSACLEWSWPLDESGLCGHGILGGLLGGLDGASL